MQAFHFSLEKVLDHRKMSEEEAMRAYGQLQQTVHAQETACTALQQEKAQLLEISEHTIGRMQVQQRYVIALTNAIDEAETKLFHVKQELAASLDQVIEAQQARKVVEKLREKKFAEYSYTRQQEEQKQLDEFANRPLFS